MNRTFLLTLAVLFGAAPAAAQTYNGVLSTEAPTRPDGQHYDAYTFEAERGQQVFVRMAAAEDFDTFLIVRSPSGQEWNNDDFNGSLNESRVELYAPEAGTWTAWASGYSSESLGPYRLNVLLGEIAELNVIEGALAEGDERCVKGEYYDRLPFQAPEGASFAVELGTPEFDGYLRVISPSGREWYNDDYGSIERSRVEFLPYEEGEWTALVTSMGSDQTGGYSLYLIGSTTR